MDIFVIRVKGAPNCNNYLVLSLNFVLRLVQVEKLSSPACGMFRLSVSESNSLTTLLGLCVYSCCEYQSQRASVRNLLQSQDNLNKTEENTDNKWKFRYFSRIMISEDSIIH